MDAVPVSVSEINDRIKNYTLENTRFCGVVRTFLPGNEVDMDMCVIDVPGDVSIDPVALRFLGNGPKLVGLTVEFGLTNDRRVVNVKQI